MEEEITETLTFGKGLSYSGTARVYPFAQHVP
jgi:hypothetical protein